MDEQTRDRLRKLQDDFLRVGSVRRHVENWGWNEPIAARDAPTFAEVRDVLLPAWESWFADFVREGV